MNKKIMPALSVALITSFVTGCASTSLSTGSGKSHHYNPEQSLAWNVTRAAEITDKFEDGEASEDQFNTFSGNVSNAGINTLLGIGGSGLGSFGMNLLFSSADSTVADYEAKQWQIIQAMDTEGLNSDQVIENVAQNIINGILIDYPESEVTKKSSRRYYIKGEYCDSRIGRIKDQLANPEFKYDKDRLELMYSTLTEEGCGLYFNTPTVVAKVSQPLFLNKGNEDKSIVRTSFYASNYRFMNLQDGYFYMPPSSKMKRPAVVQKGDKVYFFVKPNEGKELSQPIKSVLSLLD